MLQPETSLKFVVRRRAPELIAPAAPTPRELNPLSDLDHQPELRCQLHGLQFYRSHPKMANKNPATVIRDALAKVLVYYYPFAGRLREAPTQKLMVDCTGEGVLFIEAEADVTLKQFGASLHPPFPCLEELLYDVPGSNGIVDSPLLLIQVTRLLCGGFIFAYRINHTMCDGPGVIQFLTAFGEMAQGASSPSVLPVWQRELLFASEPPRATFAHHEHDVEEKTKAINDIGTKDLIQKSFFFGPNEVSTLRRRFVPEHLQRCSTFEVIAACVWRCRTIALQFDPNEEMRFLFPFNARDKLNPRLPVGYYGNAFILPSVVSTAGDLSIKPLSHVLELVTKAKALVSEGYVRSTIDLMAIKGRPLLTVPRSYILSNVARLGFSEIDFGWGKAAYGGPATGGIDAIPGLFNFYMHWTNQKGESGVLVPMYLPKAAIERFVKELNNMLM
ncbi:benzyl alcohol O-benzoyltransferase-like [Cynara cardunculus var. scolymus]|uniref:benzyl alcohol O-benzoyltransferase-like n=1 Tax=Cynara cardunculus var. scolymus TaxID=59895 RepID=UPI000D62F1B9|nr:benzyl alcohol O-benzoyltransferase-like [Cynara cardunculus var. scolymus]